MAYKTSGSVGLYPNINKTTLPGDPNANIGKSLLPEDTTKKLNKTPLLNALADVAKIGKDTSLIDQTTSTQNTNPIYTPPPAPTITDNTAMIQSQNAAILSALKQKIAESVAQGTAAQQQKIAAAPQTYDPMRATSEVQTQENLRSVLEQSANLGDRGGIGRSQALETQTAGQQRLQDINLQQQNFINDANAEIARLQSEGRSAEAQAVYDNASQTLSQVLAEQARVQQAQTGAYQFGVGQQNYLQGVQTDAERYKAEQEQNKIAAENKALYDAMVAKDKKAQQDLENKIALEKLALEKKKTQYTTSKPYYAPKSAKKTGTTKTSDNGLGIFYK